MQQPINLTTETNALHAYLRNAQSVFLTTHERTDGDDLGTVLSLYHQLKSLGKHVTVGVKGGVPKSLEFLPGSSEVIEKVMSSSFKLYFFMRHK
jgi:phosphoesterase RecJ-like protein